MNNYLAVIQAGGKGTRMLSLTGDKIPKPLLEINGKPMIQWQIDNLREHGIRDFCIITGHLGEKIEEYFGNGEEQGINISYIRENEPLGSGGALYYIKDFIGDRDIILVFGDVMIKIDWDKMLSFHEGKKSVATMLVHPNAHPFDSDLLILDDSERVVGIDSKNNKRDYWYDNLVNAGIYVLSNSILDVLTKAEKRDLEKDVLLPIINAGKAFGYRTPEYVKDAGTPERFNKCCTEQKNGVWDKKCLCNKQKAVFLDRDGTINIFNGLISKDEDLTLEVNAGESIRRINESGFLAICVTNQPVVARGMCSIEDVVNINKKMQTLLGEQGSYLDDISFCPHHPDKGYPEENPAYKIVCNCRKPATGMVDVLARKYNIDLSQSWVVGDSTLDIKLGKNAGTKTILLRTGQAGNDKKYDIVPDYIADSLKEAVEIILNS